MAENLNERLLGVGLTLASELSLPATLQKIVDLACELTGARYGALGVLSQDGSSLVEFVTSGLTQAQRDAIGRLPVGRGILGVLIDQARPLRLRDIGEDPRSVGFPPAHPPMRSFLGAPVTSRGRVFGNIYLTEKQGAPEFSAEDERALVILAAQAGVAAENARLYTEARARERRLEAVRQIAVSILAGANPDEVLALVAGSACELVGADVATIATPADEGELVLHAAEGLHADKLRGTVFPLEHSVSGEVIRTGKVVVLADAGADERAWQPIMQAGQVGPAMFVPLKLRERAIGTLMVARAAGAATFAGPDVDLTEAFAEQASVAYEHARLRAELHRLAVAEDRERIAKELHDGAIQALFAVGLGLQGAATLAGEREVVRRIEDAVDEIDRVIRDLRNYIFGLRPGILADRQLDAALQHLVAEFAASTEVVAVAEVDPRAAAVLANRAADVVQFVREALSNVRRHAAAATCRVSLYQDAGGVVLEVDDDGRGFDPARARAGNGLPNLRERAARLGGRLELASAPAEGTRVRVTVPH